MPQIKKQISVALISLLLILFIVPSVSAASETFTVPSGGSHDLMVDLNQGDNVKLNVTVSWGQDNGWLGFSSLSFKVKDPDGNIFRDFTIKYDETITTRSFYFSAPVTGKYIFHFEDSSFSSILVSNPSKDVTLTYIAIPYDPILMGTTIGVAVIIVIAVIILVAAFWRTMRKRRQEILESYSKGNLPDATSSDANIAKRTSDIVGNSDSVGISFEDVKQGILLRCNNAWLSNTEFYFKHNYYPISDMDEASVNANSTLTVKFKTGITEDFVLAPDSNVHELTKELAFYNKDAAINAFKAYLRAKNQQWADAINKLIHERLEAETVTCKYCGSKNKDTDVKCTYCGANL